MIIRPLFAQRRAAPLAAFAALALSVSATSALADQVEVYSAGSLTKVVEGLSKAPQLAGIDIKPTFGPAGRLREQIEAGKAPDLFLSADMASPRKLVQAHRTLVPAIAFAENRMCLLSRRTLGVTPGNIVEKMLMQGVRLKTSTPGADPSGDYAVMIFDRINNVNQGAGQRLRDKARETASRATVTPPPTPPGHSAAASLFLNDRIDMAIAYCSGVHAVEAEAPDVTSTPFPAALSPTPLDGMAILSAKPAALKLALFLLSEDGQAIVAAAGLHPIAP